MAAPDAAAGLAAFLAKLWGRPVTVPWLAETSAGARRRNVLFDAECDGEKQQLVATIIPNAAIQILAIPTEANVLRAARAGGVRVAEILADTADESYVGGPFFVSRRIAGETIPRRVLRLVEQVGHGEQLATQIGTAFAALHRIDASPLVEALQRPGQVAGTVPAEAALASLALQVGMLLQPSPVFGLALRWLERRIPPPPKRITLVHSDVRNGNVIVDQQGLAAILDWEGSGIGDPMADLAWPCLRTWRFGVDRHELGGFGSRQAMTNAYTAAGGSYDADAFHWWKVLGTMRWGLGLAGQARQHLDGSVPSIVFAASGRRVAELEYDVLCLLRPAGLVRPTGQPRLTARRAGA